MEREYKKYLSLPLGVIKSKQWIIYLNDKGKYKKLDLYNFTEFYNDERTGMKSFLENI